MIKGMRKSESFKMKIYRYKKENDKDVYRLIPRNESDVLRG